MATARTGRFGRGRTMATSEQHAGIDDAGRLLQRAQAAVNGGEPLEMLEALTASGYLDGLKRRLQKRWDALPPPEVDECIAQAVDAACDAVFQGRRIGMLGAWLWKAARNIADDKWRTDYSRRQDFDTAAVPARPDPSETVREAAERRALEEARRKEAIRVARELLPRIGHGQVVTVMEVLIDAAENGLPDLPASAIAEHVGISENAARTLVSRGLKRLRRLAEQEGASLTIDLPETDTDGDGKVQR